MRYILVLILVIALLFTNVSCTISHPEKIATDKNTNIEVATIAPTSTPKQTCSPTPTVTPIPSYWEPGLIYFDDFVELNKDIWNLLERKDNYNNELQYYRPQNVNVLDDSLFLTAKRESIGDHKYTSGLVDTCGKLELQYGRIEIRAKHPKGNSLFSAIWLAPTGEDYLPEIDIMEVLGRKPAKIWVVNHFRSGNSLRKTSNSYYLEDPDDFHIYTLNWSKDELVWIIDDIEIHRTKVGIPHEPMYLIINLAVGGDWPKPPDSTTPFPSDFVIDYVKIYKEGY